MTTIADTQFEIINIGSIIVYKMTIDVKYNFVMPSTNADVEIVPERTIKYIISTGFADLDTFFGLPHSSNKTELEVRTYSICSKRIRTGLEIVLKKDNIIVNIEGIITNIPINANSYAEIQAVIQAGNYPPFNSEVFVDENERYSITCYRIDNLIEVIATSKISKFSVRLFSPINRDTFANLITSIKNILDQIVVRYMIEREDKTYIDIDIPISEYRSQRYQIFYGDRKTDIYPMPHFNTNITKLLNGQSLMDIFGVAYAIQPVKKATN